MKTAERIRKDFPILNNDICYLDSAATSQKPAVVIDAIVNYYKNQNANAHRGTYNLSISASNEYEKARDIVAKFINAKDSSEIVFTKNATESLNLVANSYGYENIKSGDKIVLSIMEHHSMIVPWQQVAIKNNAKLEYLLLNDDFEISKEEIDSKITQNTKVVGISSVSNVLGVKTDYEYIIKKAHSVGAVVVLDITQSVLHYPFDAQKTDADFVVFSGHKMFGPTGIGVLYAKKELLSKMKPFLYGGDMIEYVSQQTATFAEIPNKFEAGTQNVAGAIGLKTAIEYIQNVGFENIEKIETDLTNYAIEKLSQLNFVELYIAKDKTKQTGVISFNVKGVHPHDVAEILNTVGVCIRVGNHCAEPLIKFLNLPGTCRLSLAIYNTKQDIDKLICGLNKVHDVFKKYLEK